MIEEATLNASFSFSGNVISNVTILFSTLLITLEI